MKSEYIKPLTKIKQYEFESILAESDVPFDPTDGTDEALGKDGNVWDFEGGSIWDDEDGTEQPYVPSENGDNSNE